MASVSGVFRTVRPHVPMIKFPQRNGVKQDAIKAVTPVPLAASTSPSHSNPVGNTPRGSGMEYTELPAKYQRKTISQEEIDAISRGGPE